MSAQPPPASTISSDSFADAAISNLLGAAGDQVASFLGGLLINAIMEGLGFPTEASEIQEILQLEEQILSGLQALSSEVDLQSVNIESFDASSEITNAFAAMQGFTSSTDPTTLRQFITEQADMSSGMMLSLTQYQEAVMQGTTISVGPGKTVFAVVSDIIINQKWGHVALVDLLAVWTGVMNQVAAMQVKGLSVLFNVVYAQAVLDGSASDEATTSANQAIQRFVSGSDSYQCDLQHQYAAWQKSIPDWLLNQHHGTSTSMSSYLCNKQFTQYVTKSATKESSDSGIPGYPPLTSQVEGPTAQMLLESSGPDSTTFKISNANDKLGWWMQLGFEPTGPLFLWDTDNAFTDWKLVPFLDENGIAATGLQNTEGWLAIDAHDMKIAATSHGGGDDALWFFTAA
jgi:hypothetical protein